MPKVNKPSKEEMAMTNALNLEPPAPKGPAPSVPGALREDDSKSEEQRGKSGFKGDDSNTQSSANQEFTHYYYA
eukprot:11794571-Alexandrium_andersonii.AAC.1